MSAKVKVCLIGCGLAGMIHARCYAGSVKNAELIALCDPMDENLTAVQQELKDIRYIYHDYREALLNPEIDAVVVVTAHHDGEGLWRRTHFCQ